MFATLPDDFFIEGIAFDGFGNLFVIALDETVAELPATIYKITPGGVVSTFGSTPGPCFGLEFDRAGNLFVADALDQIIYKFTPDGTRTVFVGPSAFMPDSGPVGLAFDVLWNLFVSIEPGTPSGNDTILKFTPDGVGSTFASGLDYPRGLAFDRGGNLFVADMGLFAPPGAVLKFTPDGTGTVFAVPPQVPQFLALQLLPTPRPRPSPHPRSMPQP